MKKLLIAACMMLGFAGIASAQENAPKAKKATTMKVVKNDASSAKVVKMEKATKAPAAGEKVAANPVKADGTPDMRFKANKGKAKAAPAGPTKKDGTADMRYKANKKKS